MLLTDLPYLEPILLWLMKDENLKKEFTEKSFFMAKRDLLSAVDDLIAADCPAPRALWIIPGDTVASAQRTGCKSQGNHSFAISIFVQCIRDSFNLVRRDGDLSLEGQYMELAKLRRLVKNSVHKFAQQIETKVSGREYEGLIWVRDQNLYPTEDIKMLGTALHFEIKINPLKEI